MNPPFVVLGPSQLAGWETPIPRGPVQTPRQLEVEHPGSQPGQRNRG